MPDVQIERRGAVMIVTMTREEAHNSISGTLLADLADAFDEAARDESVKVVVTTGRGASFSVGAHLPEMLDNLHLPTHRLLNGPEMGGDRGYGVLTDGQARIEELGVGRWAERIYALEKPTIAAMNGSAAGGGLGIAILHDYRVAAAQAKLCTSWTKVGVGPEMGASHLLPRLVGHRIAFDLVLRSPVLTAQEALDIGLVDRVVDRADVLESALSLADELAGIPTLSAQMVKRLMRRSGQASFEEVLRQEYRTLYTLFDTPDVKNSIAALLHEVTGSRTT